MDSTLITTREIGNHRIKIYYDTFNDCPCTNWDMAACYLFEYSRPSVLHDDCNWKELFADYKHTMNEALIKLVNDYVPTKKIIQFFKNGTKEYRLEYNSSSKMWEFKYKHWNRDEWGILHEFDSPYLHNGGWNYEMLEVLEYDELVELINDFGKDIFIKEWSTTGYSQGDYVKGVAFCTKERYINRVNSNTSDWKKKIDSLIDGEVECIGMWMWGDVKGYELEKKVEFTKTYQDGSTEEDFEWKYVHSCWGYYMKTEELIDEVISVHDLKEEVA